MTTTIPDVPIPAGFTADDWQNDSIPSRVLIGELRSIDLSSINGVGHVSVLPTAIQLSDGRIDDGSVSEPPHVHLDDRTLSAAQARALARLLIAVADVVDDLERLS